MIRNPIGFPNMTPLISLIIPKKKIRPAKQRVVFEMVSFKEFKIKIEM